MANPTWFNYEFYMGAKLAQMQKADPAGNWTTSKLVDAFAQNGFLGEDGAYEHFVQFGANEDVAPNADFNASEYYAAKAAQFYGVEPSAVTELQIANVKAIIAENGMNAWTHYVQYGSNEGVNPSNAFDADAYLAAKTEALIAAGEKQPDGSEWTAEAVQKAISDAGMTVLEHYMTYGGTGEGEVAQGVTFPVPDDQKVPAEVTGNTYELTPDLDAIVGTNGSDVIIGATQDGSATFTSGDSIDGGEGVDTLKLYGVSDVSKGLQTVKNVEQLEAFAGSGTYDVSGWEGLEKASFKAGTVSTLTANATLTDAALDGVGGNMTLTGDGIANVTVKNLDEDRSVTVVNTTENHALNVALENASKVGKDGVPTTSVTLVDAAAEALNLASNGATANKVTLTSASTALKTLTVSGEADLVVGGLGVSTLESIDGSAAKGDLNLDTLNAATLNVTTGSGDDTFVLGAATKAVTVSTGEGDDEVTLGAVLVKGSSIDLGAGDDVLRLEFAHLNKDATVNGGEGTDALVFTNNADFSNQSDLDKLNATTGFEVLGVTGNGVTLTVDSTKADFSDFLVSDSGQITLTNAQDNDTVTFGAGVSVSNSITMAARNTVLDLNLAGDDKAVANVAATVNGATTLNISSIGLLEETNAPTADNNVLALSGDNMKLNLTGDQDLTLTLTGTSKGFTVDATGFEAKLDVTGSAYQDTIKLGAEGGTVTASAGADQITFGAGADAFVASTAAGAAAAMSTIAGFTSGTDKILTSASATGAGTKANVHITSNAVNSSDANLLDALTSALEAGTHNLTVGDAYVVELTGVHAGTYVVIEKGTQSTVDDSDIVVQLAGVHAADIAVGDILFS